MTSPLVLALDAMGVIYDHSDDVAELLVPYVRSLGCTMSLDEINERYIQCSLGRSTSSQLWEQLGVANRASDVDYISHHRLTPGVLEVLALAQSRGWLATCLSNDVAEWSLLLRRRFALESFITHWIISGEVGARKPDPSIYEHLVATVSVSGEGILFIDDREKNLRVPLVAGWHCIEFGSTPTSESPDIQRVRSMPDLEAILKEFSF